MSNRHEAVFRAPDGRAGRVLRSHHRTALASCITRVLLLIVLAAGGRSAVAQPGPASESFLQQQRRIEQEVHQQMDRELPAAQKVDVDAGGWYSFWFFDYDDGIKQHRIYRQHDIRLWGSASLDQGAHEFYGRLKLQFRDFNHGDAPDGDEDDTVGPNLDRAFYQFDLRQQVLACGGPRLDWDVKFKVGRDFVEFGTGYALSEPMDHLLLTAEAAKFEATWLAGKSIHSIADYAGWSWPYNGSSERCFWGGQLAYTGFEKHKPFAYAFWSDNTRRTPWPVLLQKFDYDSWYVGLGSSGELLRNLRYGTEWVYEGGQSYGNREFLHRDRIEAWGVDALLDYLSQAPLAPRISGEYMFASGDGDRRFSPTQAIGGNTRGPDTSFVGFGWRDTGLAFAPLLSNVHIWRAGASFKPLETLEPLRNFELGTDWFLYAKNQAHGAVSDPTADRGSGYLGWEMDYFANWRITSDLAYTARFGTFFPGQSFSDRDTRTFFMTGVTWSF